MKTLIFSFISTLILLGYGPNSIDSDASSVQFTISNFAFNSVEGSFGGMDGKIEFNADALDESSFDVCILSETVNTSNQKRDDHLRNEDFFDAEQYLNICFTSDRIIERSNQYVAIGSLRILGVSKEEEILFSHENGVFEGTMQIDRTDYGLGSKGGFMIGKEVDISIRCVTTP